MTSFHTQAKPHDIDSRRVDNNDNLEGVDVHGFYIVVLYQQRV